MNDHWACPFCRDTFEENKNLKAELAKKETEMPQYAGLWTCQRYGPRFKTEIWTRDRRAENVDEFVEMAEANLERKISGSIARKDLELVAVLQLNDDGSWTLVRKSQKLKVEDTDELDPEIHSS